MCTSKLNVPGCAFPARRKVRRSGVPVAIVKGPVPPLLPLGRTHRAAANVSPPIGDSQVQFFKWSEISAIEISSRLATCARPRFRLRFNSHPASVAVSLSIGIAEMRWKLSMMKRRSVGERPALMLSSRPRHSAQNVRGHTGTTGSCICLGWRATCHSPRCQHPACRTCACSAGFARGCRSWR